MENEEKKSGGGARALESHHCIQENNIGKLTQSVDRITAKVFGNGRPGLDETVPMLSTKIEELSKDIGGLSTNVSALMTYMASDTGANRAVEKRKLSDTQWAGIIASAIFALGGIIITIILKT